MGETQEQSKPKWAVKAAESLSKGGLIQDWMIDSAAQIIAVVVTRELTESSHEQESQDMSN